MFVWETEAAFSGEIVCSQCCAVFSSLLTLPFLPQQSTCSLQSSAQLMELGPKDGKLHEFYSDRLVTVMMEVRQLTALGFVVPSKHTATMANRFYRQAVILKQVGSVQCA